METTSQNREAEYEAAALFDELPLWSAPFGLMMLERVVMRSGQVILDVGAGTGFLTLELAQRCGADSTVIAVDPWESAMNRLRRKLDHFGIRNVRVLIEDAATVTLPDASVDLIVSNLGINNFEKPDEVLRNCFRVARNGAKLFLTSNLVGHMAEFYVVFGNVLDEFGFSDRVGALEAHINHRATVDSVTKQLTRAGFELLKVDTDSFHQRFADGTALLRHRLITSAFLPAWKSVVAAEAQATVFAALESRLNQLAAKQGGISLTIPMACLEAQKPGITAQKG